MYIDIPVMFIFYLLMTFYLKMFISTCIKMDLFQMLGVCTQCTDTSATLTRKHGTRLMDIAKL